MKILIPFTAMILLTAQFAWPQDPAALNSLLEAERSFALISVEKGVREAFLAFFAEEGVNFTPHPVKTRQALLSRPAPAAPPKTVLSWNPVFAEVSRAGDLGYTTGPYMVTEAGAPNKALRHGMFFSIWKKQPEGHWRVVLDLGTQNSVAVMGLDTPFQGPRPSLVTPLSCTESMPELQRALLAADTAFLQATQKKGLKAAYAGTIHDHGRLHRDDLAPQVGRAAVLKYISEHSGTAEGKPIAADVARSCDLGYTYGSYQLPGRAGSAERGYYTRVWKRDARNRWRIAVDISSPLPPEEQK